LRPCARGYPRVTRLGEQRCGDIAHFPCPRESHDDFIREVCDRVIGLACNFDYEPCVAAAQVNRAYYFDRRPLAPVERAWREVEPCVVEVNPKLLTVDTRTPSKAAALHREMKLDHPAVLFDRSAGDGRGLHMCGKYRDTEPKRHGCNRYFRPPSLASRCLCRLNVHASGGCAANPHRGAAA
jgi:hypothetical protein